MTGQHTGRTDLPLLPVGEEQARAAGEALRGREFAAVFTSPLSRARRTAELAGFGGQSVVDPDLREWDYGPLEGHTAQEASRLLGHEFDLFIDGPLCPAFSAFGPPTAPPGVTVCGSAGETLAEAGARASRFLDRVTPLLQGGGDVLAVAHGHLIRLIAAAWLQEAPAFAARLELETAALCHLGLGRRWRSLEGWNLASS